MVYVPLERKFLNIFYTTAVVLCFCGEDSSHELKHAITAALVTPVVKLP
jgi:hypothetical protein